MNRILLLVVLNTLLFSTHTYAQTGWKWAKTGANASGDFFSSAADNKGNVYLGLAVTGAMGGPVTFGSIVASGPFVAKVDSAGNYLWVISCNASSQCITTDASGNLLVLGTYNTSVTIGSITLVSTAPPASWTQQAFLAKISPSGTVLWAKNVLAGTYTFESAFGYINLGLDAAGNIIVTGQFKPATTSIGTTTLTNTDPTGNTVDMFISKFDNAGNPLWAKSFQGNKDDFIFATAIAKNGDIYIAGSYTSDMLNIDGTILAGDPKPYLATRVFFADLKGNYLAKFNSSGSVAWAHPVDYYERIITMELDNNENLYVAGYLDSILVHGTDTFLSTVGHASAYFAKYSSTGDYKWGFSSPGWGEKCYDIAIDPCGNILVCGEMHTDLTFSGHSVPYPTGVVVFEPMFILEYDTSGTYHNSMVLNAGGDDGASISIDNRGNFFMFGDYWDTLALGPDTLKPEGAFEYLFIAKYRYQTSLCEAQIGLETPALPERTPLDIAIFPNPANNECTFSCKKGFGNNAKAVMYDVTGRQVGLYPLTGNSTIISVADLPSGLYQCRLYIDGQDVQNRKLAILR